MTRKRYTEEQIIAVLKDVQAGVSVSDLCRKHRISDAMFYYSPSPNTPQLAAGRFIERFNGKFRGECLTEHWFLPLQEAQVVIEAWRREY